MAYKLKIVLGKKTYSKGYGRKPKKSQMEPRPQRKRVSRALST